MSSDPVVLCVGLSHKTASLAARERFALIGQRARDLCAEVHAHHSVLEVVSVATCNRSEIYLLATDPEATTALVVGALARFAQAQPEELSTLLAVRSERAAVHHLLRVAAGAESVVVGEAEIQGQLKQALDAAHTNQTCGPVLDRLFRAALETGKRVRCDTGIGEGHASVGSVAARLVTERLGGLEDARILVIGAGEMGALVTRSLNAHGAGTIRIANRDGARSARLAEQVGVEPTTLGQIVEELAWCDAVVTSTAAPHHIVTCERVAEAMQVRHNRPLVLVDLAVPRDVESGVADMPGCHLFDLDDLERVVSSTMETRQADLAQVERFVDAATEEFLVWRRQQEAVPAIVAMRNAAEQLRLREYERFAGKLTHLAAEDRQRVEHLTRSLVNRLLHEPTIRLREAVSKEHAADAPQGRWTQAVQHLFGVEPSER